MSCSNSENLKVEISRYPDGKDFAFTISEDPDYGTFEQRRLLYELLDNLGFKTTIGIWTLDTKHGSGPQHSKTNTRGVTTANQEYLRYLKTLQKRGFEISLHTVSAGNDLREETIRGYELFRHNFGTNPSINTNHADNLENIYWGSDRFSNVYLKILYGIKRDRSDGHLENSRYFWGDICKERTKYVRGWTTNSLNTLSIFKSMPYSLSDKPYVNYWFGCSDGYNCNQFVKLLSDSNIKKLVSDRGLAIVYTHFAYGFIEQNSSCYDEFKKRLIKLSQLNGWFVPVSTMLHRLSLLKNVEILHKGKVILIVNNNNEVVTGLTVISNQKKLYLWNKEEWKHSKEDDKINLGDLPPYSVFKVSGSPDSLKSLPPGIFESIRIVWEWFVSRLKNRTAE